MNRPFDEHRYSRLLEGLEVTTKYLSEIRVENYSLRIDSEYFQKHFLRNAATLEAYPLGYFLLGDELVEITGGATPLGADYPESGVRFLRVQNIMPNYIDDSDMTFISTHDDAELLRSRLKKEDVLLTITGVSYGKAATVTSEFVGSNINQHSVRMKLRANLISPIFLATFLNARPGKLQSDRNITGVTRPALDYESIRRFRVPCISSNLQKEIGVIVDRSHVVFEKAKRKLQDAEATLTSALDFADWQPPEPLSYVRSASETLSASRFDAEFFHPAKQSYLDRLRALPGKPLGDHYASVREMFDPAIAATGDQVRNFDLTDALQPVLDNRREPIPAKEVGSTKKRFKWGDVVTSRLRAYLRETALVRTSSEIPSVGSSEFIVLRSRDGDQPHLGRACLLIFLRSRPVQTILKWSQDGSHHPRYGDEDLLSIPVPDAVCAASLQIEAIFENALTAREDARNLLAAAQRAVELAIEDSESAALAYLAEQTGEIKTAMH